MRGLVRRLASFDYVRSTLASKNSSSSKRSSVAANVNVNLTLSAQENSTYRDSIVGNDRDGADCASFRAPLTSYTAKQRSTMTDFSMAKLQFGKLVFRESLYRREDEAFQMRQVCFKAAEKDANGPHNHIRISGQSGMGKSALADTRRHTVARHFGFFIKRKFDLKMASSSFRQFWKLWMVSVRPF